MSAQYQPLVNQETQAPAVVADVAIPVNKKIVITGNEGVFANMAAKPETRSDEKPPSYDAASDDRCPTYMEATVIDAVQLSEETLVDGLPVGSFLVFFCSAFISGAFGLLGFLVTFLLSTSHAGRSGARLGLGATVISLGMFLRSKSFLDEVDQEDAAYAAENGYQYVPDHAWVNVASYLFVFLGWFIIIRSVSDYVRARRIKSIIESTPTTVTQVYV